MLNGPVLRGGWRREEEKKQRDDGSAALAAEGDGMEILAGASLPLDLRQQGAGCSIMNSGDSIMDTDRLVRVR
jgi:hypothetical protein